MDSPASNDLHTADSPGPVHAVLAEVTCRWLEHEPLTAVILHATSDMLVLEGADPRQTLPPLGTAVQVSGGALNASGRLAEHGRAGRFLVSLGSRPVRSAIRMRVSLPGTLRSALLPEPRLVEIADLSTAGARVRGVELPVNSQVTLDFTPPGREHPVTVRALVAHATHGADRPWIGLIFRLVALRGGR
jgi:hypothetical protein